jgi:serine/threonine-protein kinase
MYDDVMSGEGPKIRGDEQTALAPSGEVPLQSTMTPSSEGVSSLSPQVLAGRYTILGLVGVGGMGSVYRARDAELDEIVALKLLRRELVDTPGMLDRFRQEVKLSRRVTHPNVARMFDIGEHAGEKFLTMEYVDGESLASRLADRQPSLEEIIALTRAICAGLAAAHAAGVVHRDLKPDNVLLGKDGRIALSDFGIARAVRDAEAAVKTSGMPIGTPAYMAPEQVEGGTVDARTDIYALGAMLYELLTRERPWQGESLYAIAAARLTQPPPDPRALRPGIPASAAEIVMRCMARKPADRYASVDDVLRAIDAAMSDYERGSRAPAPTARSPQRAEPEAKTVGVLPFRNNGKPEDDYLAEGLTDDLIDALSMARGLRVRARGAVMRFKGVDRDPREIGRELEVQVVVDGSVRKVGDKLRVNARLVSVADGFQLWARRFDRPEQDFLAVGDEAANAIAEALTVERGAPLREAPTDPVAIDLYLRARHEYNKGWIPNVEAAIALYHQALARAPDDPTILSGYALAELRKFANDSEGTDESGDRGRRAAERALALAPHLGEARIALANYALNMGDAVEAARATHEALAVSPGSSEVHDMRGRLLTELGEPDEGIGYLRTAIALEPLNGRAKSDMVRALALLGHWPAVDATLAGWAAQPDNSIFYWFMSARLALWRHDVAWAERIRDAVQTSDFPLKQPVIDFTALTIDGTVMPSLATVAETWGKMASRAKRRPLFFRQLSAEVFAFIGKTDVALDAVESAADFGLIDITWVDRCPLLAPLRSSPRFLASRAKIADRARAALDALNGRSTG